MKRRSFMGLLGGVVGAGPKGVVKLAAPASMESALGLAGISAMGGGDTSPDVGMGDSTHYAKRVLQRLALPGSLKEKIQRDRHWISALDADTASLRSVSMGRKIAMSRRIQYDQHLRQQRTWYQGVVDKLWD